MPFFKNLALRRRYRELPPTRRRMALMLAITAIVLFLIFGFEAFRTIMIHRFLATLSNPPQTVSTAPAQSLDWQPQLQAVGSLRAVNGADLSIELAGIVDKIGFNSGDDVAAGATLLELRAEDDVAHLHSLQASAALAQINYDRDAKQLKIQAVSQAQLDSDAANLKNAQAQVAEQQAVVDKKTLRAPFAGHLGIRAVDVGQYLTAGTTIVTLQALDPIYVDFYLPQQALEQIKNGQKVRARIDTYPGVDFAGTISAINPKVEVDTRNIQVRATLANPDHRMLPGMFATIAIDIGTPRKYVTLPQTAITYNPYGATVYLVDDYGKDAKSKDQLFARQTFVTTGETRGDQVQVLKGVKDGEIVVSAGQLKLHNGTPLIIDNSVVPANDADPRPADQ
ncbi:MAG TPA: efflux RND transporter periplasmic adaptor subunit [Stellaceae bacterium]|nr:efflux RND transporter periplasmic adaptor subunit [Stellaceae bacterium]